MKLKLLVNVILLATVLSCNNVHAMRSMQHKKKHSTHAICDPYEIHDPFKTYIPREDEELFVVLNDAFSEGYMFSEEKYKAIMPGSFDESSLSYLQYFDTENWIDCTKTNFRKGDGLTKETAFEIETEKQLALLAQKTNNSEEEEYLYYKLVEDLNMSGKNWSAIGTKLHKFNGYFDGNNHTISNIQVSEPELSGQGLFGYVQSESIIENLILNNPIIKADFYVGGIVGQGIDITLRNCKVINGYISGEFNYVGGLIGDAAGSIVEDSSVQMSSIRGGFLVGNIHGNENNVKISNCLSYLVDVVETDIDNSTY